MQLALNEAELALIAHEVPVGCVFVNEKTQDIIAVGHNKTNETYNATQHAEIVAINDALLSRGKSVDIFAGTTLYVTCEPCM